MNKRIEMACNNCGQKAFKLASQVRGNFYCCKQCYYDSLKGKTPHNKGKFEVHTKKCLHCNAVMSGQKSNIEKRKFCSRQCSADYHIRFGITENGKYTKLYLVWRSMRNRCSDRNNNSYYRYGGRGITVCEQWNNDFQTFRSWCMVNGYEEGLTLERVDNDGNYEPSNCRFATKKEQANNTSKTVHVEIDDELLTLNEISEKYKVEYSLVKSRYARGKRGNDIIKERGYYNKPLFSKQFLLESYINQKKSMVTIANENNVSSSAILKYLKRYNIERRSLSETTKLSWPKRRE